MKRRGVLAVVLAAGVGLLVGRSEPARADEPFTDARQLHPAPPPSPPPAVARPTLDAFSYASKPEKNYLRGALEVSTILIVGNVDYLLNTGARGGTARAGDQRWDLRYDWPTFHDKLSGDFWKVDTNHFNTNYISHPFAGTMYYTAARSAHLSVVESYGYTLVGALAWEMFGELREEVSINDVIVTSSAGLAIGETLTQLSSFFYRSRKNPHDDFLAAFFSPVKAVNDWADGAVHARSSDLDAAGLTRDEWHRFEVFAGVGVTRQPSGTYVDQRFGLDLQLVNLPGWADVGRRSAFFDDGNAATLHFESTLSRGKLADGTFTTRVVPLGVYQRRAERAAEDGAVHGDSALLGWLATFEYSVHDYDRDRARPIDLLTVLSPVGLTAEYVHDAGSLRVRSRFDLSGDFAGVTSYALDDYRLRHHGDETNLQTVLKQEGYYHSLGATAGASLDVTLGALDVGSRVTLDTWRGIEGFDEQQQRIASEIPLADRRLDARAWIGAKVPRVPLRLEVLGRSRYRTGEVGDVRASQREQSVFGSLGCVF
jgi:hypothetical protein